MLKVPDPFEVVSALGSLLWDFARTPTGLCFFIFALIVIVILPLYNYVTPFIRFHSREIPPTIGYKQAYVYDITFAHDYTEVKDIQFSGVFLGRYDAKDKSFSFNDFARKSKGFHMYDTYKNALFHVQGNSSAVVLEVLGLGKMIELEKGTITSEQRVLQVIVTCREEYCKQTPRYCLVPKNMHADYTFACSKHSKNREKNEKRVSLLPLLDKTHYVPADHNWYGGEKVPLVIGVDEGEGSVQPFTPTRLP